MSSLATPLRRQLEKAIQQARKIAEGGARHALEALAVHEPDAYPHMSAAQLALRRQLQAQAKQLGDGESRIRPGAYDIKHLAEKLAYDQWHRLLFARYLLENSLLISPEHGVAVSLDDCEELSPSLGLKDAWAVAARFAARELPEIFRADDPAGAVELSVNDRQPLIALVTGLAVDVFTASDSLGWCYQFWQAEEKERVNKAGNKIGADELPAVTQLFTEDYMVDFLLDNTLGAWHAGKVLAANPKLAGAAQSEDELRQAVALPGCAWKYLRFVQGSAGVSPAMNGGQDARPPFFDPHSEVDVSEHRLPHWQQGDAWIFATWRLADSLPAEKLREWQLEKTSWLRLHPEPWDADVVREFHERFSKRMEAWLDAGEGSCLLRDPATRRIVTAALAHFDGERYELGDFVVMPNHVHVLFRPLARNRIEEILHSWKSFTAKEINRHLGRSGSVWQEDYWDRLIRSERHLSACQRYIESNPAKANLPPSDWSAGVPPAMNGGQDARPPLWTPAAGSFDGWPKTAKELKCLDPCMGSGHFVVAMFERLVALRLAEEKLIEADAVDAVIHDNLFGLEIDPRCTQIGAFNLALAAWRRVGHRPLPAMNLACSGLAPNAKKDDWLKLAGDNDRLQRGMARLHTLFKDAPVLGSLINPCASGGDLLEAGFLELQPLLENALAQETQDDAAHEMAVIARGLAKAAEILAGKFTLVATNVPYLGLRKQDEELIEYCSRVHPDARADLATCFVERCLNFCAQGGSTALVTPQNWLFLGTYKKLRQRLLETIEWNCVLKLGEGGFASPQAAGAFTAMLTHTRRSPSPQHNFSGADVSEENEPSRKADALLNKPFHSVGQAVQITNPDARIVFEMVASAKLLCEYSDGFAGVLNGDTPRFVGLFWEQATLSCGWECLQSTVEETVFHGGREAVIYWQKGKGELRQLAEELRERLHDADRRGNEAWGKFGVAVSSMRSMPVTLYTGELFDSNAAVILPKSQMDLVAIWAFCSSPSFHELVRRIDQATKVTNATLVKIPFDLAHWQKVAAEKYPHGLPKPFSSDPTQWLFNGHPNGRAGILPAIHRGRDARAPLHVAVARLLGYQWPRQTGSSFPDCPALGPDGLETLADADGIVPISPAKGEGPATERLRELLVRAYGPDWNAARQEELLAQVGYAGASLEDWLRNGFFEQHCALFHHRPFIWQVWDGLKNGFSALVNYHKLSHANLEKLTYSTLGNWIQRQQAGVTSGEAGSDAKLQAARQLQATLKLILEGQPPYDIFVRWKPLAQQASGWQPDLNDGVRMNIRPFATADILRKRVKIKWDKDRGKEPMRNKAEFPWFWGWDEARQDFAGVGNAPDGNRWNNCHYSLAAKQAAKASQAARK